MKAIDVAGMFIQRHGDSIHLTNLSLNKLVYFAQVESIRRTGEPLFDDEVQAWNYGPVEPEYIALSKSMGAGKSLLRWMWKAIPSRKMLWTPSHVNMGG